MSRSTMFARPGGSRGLLPLILGALAAGRAIYGAVNANQTKQRNKGYIDDAYRSAQQRQRVHEGDVRQGTAEELAARGLGTSGAVQHPATRIAQAMGAQTGAIAPSTTLGARAQHEDSREFALERRDLSSARDQAQRENKADAINAQISSVINGATGIANAYGLSQLGQAAQLTQGATDPGQQAQLNQISAAGVPPIQTTPSKIGAAMGLDNPSNWWGGIHPLNPLTAPGSAWNLKETLSAPPGLQNENFHV